MTANRYRMNLYPFQLQFARVRPANPALCEPHTEAYTSPVAQLEFLEGVVNTRDQRQCRGCGLWVMWEPRAITDGKRTSLNCPCCTRRPMESADCWCPTECASDLCQARDDTLGTEPGALTVTERGFPHGVQCSNCKREIPVGEPYKLRDKQTGKLSTGPYTEDRTDAPFCGSC